MWFTLQSLVYTHPFKTYRNVSERRYGKLVKSKLKSTISHLKSCWVAFSLSGWSISAASAFVAWSIVAAREVAWESKDPWFWPKKMSAVDELVRHGVPAEPECRIGGSRAFFPWCHGPPPASPHTTPTPNTANYWPKETRELWPLKTGGMQRGHRPKCSDKLIYNSVLVSDSFYFKLIDRIWNFGNLCHFGNWQSVYLKREKKKSIQAQSCACVEFQYSRCREIGSALQLPYNLSCFFPLPSPSQYFVDGSRLCCT